MAWTGDLDLASESRTVAIADKIVSESPDLDLDLSGVTFIDSSGLSQLVMLHHRCREHGGNLILRSPSERVVRVLDLTGLTAVFKIED